MRVEVKPDREYAWFIRPFFWLQQRNYGQVLIPGKCWGRSPRLFAAVATLYGVINRKRSPIDPVLRSLVTVRVSQLNWCRFCVDINAMTLIKRAGSSEKVEALAQWRTSPLFDEREKAVLDYTEAMTGLDGVSDEQAAEDAVREAAEEETQVGHFTPKGWARVREHRAAILKMAELAGSAGVDAVVKVITERRSGRGLPPCCG